MARDEKLMTLKEAVSKAKAAFKKTESDLKQYQKEKAKADKLMRANKAKAKAVTKPQKPKKMVMARLKK